MKWIAGIAAKWLVGILVVIGGAYALYASMAPSATARYKLTVSAEVDGKACEGSGVLQVTFQNTTRIFGSLGGTGNIVKGEAIAIDCGDQKLFVLVSGQDVGLPEGTGYPARLIFDAFRGPSNPKTDALQRLAELRATKPRAEISTSLLPMVVRFRDLKNPESVERVDVTNSNRTSEPKIRIVKAIVEITDDAITKGIGEQLIWLDNLERNGGTLDGSRISRSNELANRVGGLAFRRK